MTSRVSLELTLKNLTRNYFLPYFVTTPHDAYDLFFGTLLPDISPAVVSYADSVTLSVTGIIERLKRAGDWLH